ncbi:hypothetical protein [Sedimenticola thiotaurini]|uniref:Uncharacterized protein n=1 Tax=Sedimenticola thiotaurini TaxID=1543721 RepID=A0A0F7K0A8_9GAMM|nr:hypothetical protein [Sedimenticola thiotaurini]AKH20413.1 hypothetical protein AAY24_08670 [Sedimenticola thiotaurini]
MKDNSATTTNVGEGALEMIMRDVLDGLLELSLESSLCADIDGLDILEIRHPAYHPYWHEEHDASVGDATIIDFPDQRRACG